MIKDAKNRPISELFNTESSVIYRVPRYQREFTWGKSQVERLFDDIWDNEHGYFIGSIICINRTEDALDIQELEVIDGQQRLITLQLLFAALYVELQATIPPEDLDKRTELVNLKNRIVLKRKSDQIRVIPQVQGNNDVDFRAKLAEVGVIHDFLPTSYAPLRRIYKTFDYLHKRMDKMIDGKKDSLSLLLGFLDKVNQSCLVKIEVDTHSDAFILFESINNTGIPLSAVDLIKNKMLASLEKKEPGKIDHYFKHWNTIIKYLSEDYSVQERFFRHYYNAFREELRSIYQVPIATRSNLIHIYEKLIENDPKGCLEKLILASKLYSQIILEDGDAVPAIIRKPLESLDLIQGAPSHLLLLFLFANKEDLELTDENLANITKILVSFFVRRNLTDIPPTRDLTRIFMDLIGKLGSRKGDSLVSLINNYICKQSASDELFLEKLEGPIYEENADATRFILCSIAKQKMTRETDRDLWEIKGKEYIWTVEHIFPQGERIPQSWVDMIADGDKKLAKELQQIHVHKLGNLTITKYNSKLSTYDFKTKRDRKENGQYIGYKNGLSLNMELASEKTWSISKIEKRTKKLAKKALKMFSLDGV